MKGLEVMEKRIKNLIDLTGLIYNGMWHYAKPYTGINIKPLSSVDWVEYEVYAEALEGMHSQTGTYLETNAHFYGFETDKTRSVNEVSVEEIVDINCNILQLEDRTGSDFVETRGRSIITRSELEKASSSCDIKPGEAILLSTGWGQKWFDADFLSKAPYISYSAMEWILEQDPSLVGSDSAAWDNGDDEQGFFPMFYDQDVLMLAPLVNLEKIKTKKGKLTVLPIHVKKTSAAPCRAIFYEY